MTRIAIIADSHFDEASRFDECIRVHHWIAEDIRRREVDLVLHAGDVFERKSSPRERLAFATWLQLVCNVAPVVVVRGNHDVPGDLTLFEQLDTKHPVVVARHPEVHHVAGVAVGCLPWPRRAELLAQAKNAGLEDIEHDARQQLRNVLRGLATGMAEHEGPRVLLAHAMVSGSVTSTGQPLVGCDMELSLDDLALAGADFIALGHIHQGQDWPGVARRGVATGEVVPVVYPGSPRRTAFGEVESKGYVIAELESGLSVGASSWERVETPCTQMVLLEDEWADAEGRWAFRLGRVVLFHDNIAGAEVRYRYRVPSDQREPAKAAADEFRHRLVNEFGAVDVKLEPVVIATTRARVPEVAAARGLGPKLEALWVSQDQVPSPERAKRLLAIAGELEEEVRSAS